ncbi:hypothetical protein [Clostridium thermobutyricum]|uniref:hypothetical protein n=1 Tax=Clostridium thermobutyricum TaxID=29372 RepID=UPI002943EAD6|nr:hypothetical protein [Clostridium thermobutyricum]
MFYKYKKIIIAIGLLLISIIGAFTIHYINNNITNSVPPKLTNINKISEKKSVPAKEKKDNIKKEVDNNHIPTVVANSNLNDENNNTTVSNQTPLGVIQQPNNKVNYNTKNIVTYNNESFNYNCNLNLIDGKNTLQFKIDNAKLISNNNIQFNFEILKNENFGGISVFCTDNFGNVLAVNPIGSIKDGVQYEVGLVNPNTKCIEVSIQSQNNSKIEKTIQIALNKK